MKLSSYRESQGLTIQQAASMFKVAHETWRRWENGERRPSLEEIAAISEWSSGNVSTEDFLKADALKNALVRVFGAVTDRWKPFISSSAKRAA